MLHPLSKHRDEIESAWKRHVLEAWFPRCLDRQFGGFLCDFDRHWRTSGSNPKFLEFQARQTMLAAEALYQFPGESRLEEAAHQGFSYLRDHLWDHEHGGWFHCLDRSGTPLNGGIKHAHGTAYAIQACVAYAKATSDSTALDLAQTAFEWLDTHSYDQEHGGYWGPLNRDGTLLRGDRWSVDGIGTPLGYKDLNVHSDLLEALLCLHVARPSKLVEQRSREVLKLLLGPGLSGNGSLFFYLTGDLEPVPHAVNYGVAMQTVCRFIWAEQVLGADAEAAKAAVRVFEHARVAGKDHRAGGYWLAGVSSPPFDFDGADLIVRRKQWWVQSEALRALCILRRNHDDPSLDGELEHLWPFTRDSVFDHRHGGTFALTLSHLRPLPRLVEKVRLARRWDAKGHSWKDASHDGRAMLHLLRDLDGGGSHTTLGI